jgi:hypothetical protein
MTRFRQALLDELQSRVVADPVPAKARHRLTRPRLAFGGALVAVAAATATVLATGGGAPAYAITTEKDGTLAVAVNRVDDPSDANRELAVVGDDKVKILRPSAAEDCPGQDRGTLAEAPPGVVVVRMELSDMGAGTRVTVRPGDLPDDLVVVLVALGPMSGNKPAVRFAVYKAPGPKCVVAPTR